MVTLLVPKWFANHSGLNKTSAVTQKLFFVRKTRRLYFMSLQTILFIEKQISVLCLALVLTLYPLEIYLMFTLHLTLHP